jgi:Tryptophan-associated transmembrane protein (Trp_oprn_chp)
MTAGPDPKRVPPARERGFGGPRDPDEPRFAGPPTAGTHPAPLAPWAPQNTPVTWSAEPAVAPPARPAAPPYQPPSYPPATFPPPTFPAPVPGAPQPDGFGLEPVVDYGPGVQLPVAPRDGLAISRLGSAIAAAGGLLAALGSLFTWATLRLTDEGGGSQGFTSVSFNGLSLLEGRIILVLGIVSMGLAAAVVPRNAHRLLAVGLAITGGLGVIVMAFAAIGHPVELATLFRSYRQINSIKVSLPNGVGTWLAVIGALLVLAGGLLALMRGSERQGEGRA